MSCSVNVPNVALLRSVASGPNFKITLEYDGTGYAGWQTQSRRPYPVFRPLRGGFASLRTRTTKTIQETVEKVLGKILQEEVRLIASGRTDAGVHAQAQVANFKTHSPIRPDKLQAALNGLLPKDIAVTRVEKVSPDFHSRFDAKAKIYRYTILNRGYRSAFLRDKAYFYPYPLDIKLMQKEARILLGRHDFKSFCASGSSAKDTVRTIKRISIKRSKLNIETREPRPENRDPNLIIIEIEADGFLYNMVRNIVGTLMEIGRGRLSKGGLKKIFAAGDRKLAGPTAPACGLCLLKVKY